MKLTSREEQRIARAKALGWRIESYPTNPPTPTMMGIPPGGEPPPIEIPDLPEEVATTGDS